ncbi:uncharacterized protein LOC18442513 isoform X3 [Amborella trichopoda]|uniref:uncharacterized protein LOC18442513 isoform X3 n=1 Tax=Amborella trichopoda TaxID=13333 RepID=UPI0009C04921|nr:uncharacterized protein LOC18442513 isoform X3 [Amborella trichopoda]|eukprot:XP_020528003.1 uncharacterized protein LOC18442513 isoform X3 [Amborella trichopoda]
MDNSWPGKVGPSWPGPPSSVPRNQFEMNADQYFLHTYAQEANVSNTMNFGSTPYNCKMANPEFANSFISLLAGGPSQQICGEFQQLTSSRSGMATTSPPINENIVNGPELYQVIGSRNPLAFNSGRGLVFNDGNLQPKSSHLHGSNAAKQVFSDHTPRDNEIVSQRSPIQWLIGTTNTKQQNNAHISSYTRFKLPSDSKCDVIDQASSIVKGLTRAYCLGKSGDLLLIEGGHLGIVCSCHGLHMSVAKFCEHSGSSVINPGEAVRTGSGETVAQWRRENYIKLGIKLPDDTAGWDWPDGSTANAGKPKYKSACIQKNQNIEKNSGVSRHGYPFDGQPRSEQPWNNANSFNYPRGGLAILESSASRTTEIVRPKDGDNSNLTSPSSMPAFVSNHTTHALNDTLPGPKVTRASLDKGSEHCEYQSIVDYIEFISKGGNPFVTNQRSTNLKSFNGGSTARRCNRTREVFMLDKDAMASNIELRLGQPSQQSQARNCSLPSSIRSQSFNAIGDQKSLFCEQLIQRGPNNYCKCCNLTTAPSISLQPRGIDVHSSHCHQNCCVEQPLLRLASRSNHHNNCCVKHARCNQAEPNPCVCSNFWCAEHLKSFAGSCSSRMGAHAEGSLKENNGNTAVDKTSLLLPPSIDDGFRSSLDKTTELKRCENLETLDIVKRSCNTMQWRDVPGKIMDSSATTDIERPAKMMCRARNEDQLADTASKRFDEGCQDAGSLKEQQMSNVCSESSAAVVTEFSGRCFVNLDLGSTRSTCDEIVDEGSGIEKCCSSDAHNAGMWAETANLSGNTDAVLGRSSTLPSHSTDPINNLKVRSSLRLKKVRLPFGSPKGENAVHKKQVGGAFKIERKRKTMKWKKLDASLSGSGTDDRQYELVNRSKCSAMCVYPEVEKSSHADLGPTKSSCFCTIATLGPKRKRSTLTSSRPLNLVGDACTLDGPSRKYIDSGQGRVLQVPIFPKEWKNNREMTKDKDKSGVQHGGEDPNVQEVQKYSKMGLGKSISALPNNYCNDQKARPIVCGNLGIIANVNSAEGLQKAAKVVSLSSILRRAKRCTNENQEMRFSSMSETQNKFSNRSQGCHTTPCAASRVKDKEGHDSVETSAADWFSAIQMHQTANAVKEVRKYSLNELTQKGKHANKQACLNHLSRQEHLQSREKNLCPRSATQNDKLVDNLNGIGTEKQSRTPNSCTRKNSICMQRSVFRTSEKLCLENVKETQGPIDVSHEVKGKKSSTKCRKRKAFILDSDVFCCVCGGSDKDDFNCILECSQCLIKVHQACYGVLKAPKGRWCCRPCRADIKDIVCVLCGYSGGAMTRALRSRNIVKNLLQTWKIKKGRKSLDPFHLSDSKHDDLNGLSGKLGGGPSRLEKMDSISAMKPGTLERVSRVMMKANTLDATSIMRNADILVDDFQVHNTITAAVLDPNVTQWLHMVCGLWMPGTRCPNVDTMSAFDVSGVSPPKRNTVCSICKRPGGSCIRCRVADCSVFFHPWCAHQKGLLQSEIEGVDNENVGFYGRCLFHAVNINCLTKPVHLVNDKVEDHSDNKDPTCARTEGYKGRKKEGLHYGLRGQSKDNSGCLVPQEQINAWLHINGQKSCTRGLIKPPASDTEYDCRKEYARYKQSKGWKQLVVYKSGIHALGLYTSQFIFRGAMVVEYVGEIVGLRVADKREAEYHSGRRIQYESACYFFRIDKEHIIDATRKGGIARFVNHSCLPNCVAKVITIRNEKKVVFFAERDINPGEEITYDYHFNNEDEGKKIPCFCNSKNCRRFLN